MEVIRLCLTARTRKPGKEHDYKKEHIMHDE